MKFFDVIYRKRRQIILYMFFKAVMICNTLWHYCFCFVLLRQKKAVEIFICVEILIKIISKFNVYRKAVACHYILSNVWYKKSNKFSIAIPMRQKVTCTNKVFIFTTIEKFNLFWNSTLIKGIFYFLKTMLFCYISKGIIFKFLRIYKFIF